VKIKRFFLKFNTTDPSVRFATRRLNNILKCYILPSEGRKMAQTCARCCQVARMNCWCMWYWSLGRSSSS